MSENSKPRIFKYDNVRLLMITLVVIGSFAEEFTSRSDMFRSWFIFVYSFHAPTFIFLSGLFTKGYRDGRRPDPYRLSFYFGLGMALKVLIFLLRRLKGEDVGIDFFGGATMEWYLFVIVMYSLTMYLLRSLNPIVVLTGSVALGTLAGFLPLGDEFYLMRYFVFMPFYAAGYYLTPAKVRRFSHNTVVKLFGITFMFIYFVLCFRAREIIYPARMLFTGRNPYANVPIEGCTFYHRLICYAVSTALIISVLAIVPNFKFPLLTHMGRNTLGVYFWHYPLVLILWRLGVMDMLIPLGDPLWKLVVLTAAVIAALVLAVPVFSWPLTKLFEKVRTMPPLACLTMDIVIIIGATVGNLVI